MTYHLPLQSDFPAYDLLSNVTVVSLHTPTASDYEKKLCSTAALKRLTLHNFGCHQEKKREARVHKLMKVKVGILPEMQKLLKYLI